MFQGKVICDHCNTPNDSKSVRCVKCGSILDETVIASDSFREQLNQRVAEIQDRKASQEVENAQAEPTDPVGEPDVRQKVVLIEQSDGREFHIKQNPSEATLVGRFPKNDQKNINLSGVSGRYAGVSRLHASFKWNGNILQLIDKNSRNGTYVNGERLTPEEAKDLNNDDIISFGYVSFLLSFQ